VEIGSRGWGLVVSSHWGLCVILSEVAGLDIMCSVWLAGLGLFGLLIVGTS